MRALLVGVALTSAASLILQIVLTRIFSIVQWYHFAFMAVGLGLLGYGASGTALAASRRLHRAPIRTAAWSALLVLPATGMALLAIARVPFDAYLMGLEAIQSFYLAALVAALVVPFFCCGLTIGAALVGLTDRARSVYAASFVGGGAGALGAVLLLSTLTTEGVMLMAAAVAGVGASLLWWSLDRRAAAATGLLAVVTALVAPAAPQLPASPYKALNQLRRHQGARIEFSASNAIARVDVVRSAALRSAPGLSHTFPGVPPSLPGLTTDGEGLRGLPATGDAAFTAYLPTAVAYELRPGRALIIGIGVEVLGALRARMAAVTVVETNPLVARAARNFAGSVIGEQPSIGRRPDVQSVGIVVENPRTYVRRTPNRFDVIQVPALESFQVVASGTFSLAENYIYTVEGFRDLMDALTPDGILAVTRWIQTPPSEEIRVWVSAVTALEAVYRRGHATEPERSATASQLIALRSLSTMTVLVKPDGFTAAEVSNVRRFADERRFDITFAPGVSAAEGNRFNVLPVDIHRQAFVAILDPSTREAFLRDYPFDVRPVSDSRPFFFHFFRWRQIPRVLATWGRTWQPFGGGGYLVLIVLLVIATLLSVGLILAPLRRLLDRKGTAAGAGPRSVHTSAWTLRATIFAYFLALGLAYLFVEIPLLQQAILILGSPTYALAGVLFGLLVCSGLGSLMLPRVRRWVPGLILTLAGAAIAASWVLPDILNAALGLALSGRIVILTAIVAPLGVLMGVPFPAGIHIVGERAPSLIPWAWGINGCASVIASIVAALLALEWGFRAVLLTGGLAYAAAGIAMRLGRWDGANHR